MTRTLSATAMKGSMPTMPGRLCNRHHARESTHALSAWDNVACKITVGGCYKKLMHGLLSHLPVGPPSLCEHLQDHIRRVHCDEEDVGLCTHDKNSREHMINACNLLQH